MILLHSLGYSSQWWENLPKDLLSKGYAVLTIDLRGHGKSVYNSKLAKMSWKSLTNSAYAKYPDDIIAVVNKIKEENPKRIFFNNYAIVGADIGASAGIIAADKMPNNPKTIVMISPVVKTKGLYIPVNVAHLDGVDFLSITGTDDIMSKDANSYLVKFAQNEFLTFTSESKTTGMLMLKNDSNMRIFAERMNITSSRMKNDYGQSTIDEIIEAEAKNGNSRAVNYAQDYYHSPEKLIEIYKLTDAENKYALLMGMSSVDREQILPLLEQEDLVMGLYFFTQEKLLMMLMNVDIKELVNVVNEAFPLEKLVMMFTEEDLSKFMANKDLKRYDVMEQLKSMPPEVIQKFVEGVTGKPSSPESFNNIIMNLNSLSDDKFSKFMSMVDPDVQRQLTFQLTKQNPKYLELFENKTYVIMLSTLMKPDMVKPMIMLEKETLVDMMLELTPELMSIVGAQINAKDFAKFLQDGRMELLEKAFVK